VEELWAEKEQDQESLRLWEDSLVATQAWALEELTKAQRDNSVRAVFEGLAKTAYSCAQDCSNWQATFGKLIFYGVAYLFLRNIQCLQHLPAR
jgi:hypothetical protein